VEEKGEQTKDKGEIEVKKVKSMQKGQKKNTKKAQERSILAYYGKEENIIFLGGGGVCLDRYIDPAGI
jgi:hypothetical protein